MDKLRLFEFITVVLPALIFILLSMLIFGIKIPDELESGSLLFLVAALPVSLFLGHWLSHIGGQSEQLIGKITKQRHPIVNIFNKQYPEVRDDLKELFPNVVNDDENDQQLDSLFDKGRVILYQQNYSARAESLAIQATFFRNIIPISIILPFFYLFVYLIGFNQEINDLGWQTLTMVIISSLIIVIIARWLSQKLYTSWFYEILKNLEIYFKTENINNNGDNN